MGIGRREFLKACGAAFLSFATVSRSTVALVDDLYVHRKFGFAFRKPTGWQFNDIKQMEELANGLILANDDWKPTQGDLNWFEGAFAIIQAPSDNSSDYAAAAQFFLVKDCPIMMQLDEVMNELARGIVNLPPPPSRPPNMLKRCRDDIDLGEYLYKEFKVIERPRGIHLSNCPAATYTATFLMEHECVPKSVEMRAQSIFALHRDLVFMMRFIDTPAMTTPKDLNFDPLISSIAFE